MRFMAEIETSLDRYLRENGMNLSGLAAQMGKSPSTLTRPLKGTRDPSVGLAKEVEQFTKGAVTAAEFIQACILAGAPSETTEPAA